MQLRVAAVGTGTSRVLDAHSPPCAVAFIPSQARRVAAAAMACAEAHCPSCSQADGAHLAAELPQDAEAVGPVVLYPSSAKAGSDLQASLSWRTSCCSAPLPMSSISLDLFAGGLATARLRGQEAEHLRYAASGEP